MARKQIDVLSLLEFANHNLERQDEFVTAGFKAGICIMIEKVLMETGNYAGFGFLDNNDSDTGTLGYYSRHYYYSSKMRDESNKRSAA
jgi:hypothetical protein